MIVTMACRLLFRPCCYESNGFSDLHRGISRFHTNRLATLLKLKWCRVISNLCQWDLPENEIVYAPLNNFAILNVSL